MNLWHRVRDWWQARQRGEQRTAPASVRGRVYTKRPGIPGQAKARPEATIRARVYRAATGKWEDHGIISGKD